MTEKEKCLFTFKKTTRIFYRVVGEITIYGSHKQIKQAAGIGPVTRCAAASGPVIASTVLQLHNYFPLQKKTETVRDNNNNI